MASHLANNLGADNRRRANQGVARTGNKQYWTKLQRGANRGFAVVDPNGVTHGNPILTRPVLKDGIHAENPGKAHFVQDG